MTTIEMTTVIVNAAVNATIVTIVQVVETEVGSFEGMKFTATNIGEVGMYVQAIARRRYGIEGKFIVAADGVEIATIYVTREDVSVTATAE